MSSEKISALPSHTLNSADIIPVANGGANYGDTVGQIETAAAALVHWSALLGDLAETQVIPFDGGTPGTADTGISRLGAASLAIGNGTAGDYSGALKLKNLTATNSVVAPILEANNTINVKYYGATGNGTTDDTTAINAAIAAITSTYATLYFPSGTYVVSSTSP